MADDSDRSVTQALRQRNRSAWGDVYEDYAPDLFTFLVYLVHGDRTLADELHQETWLAALGGIDGFDSARGELRSWLFGIAKRQVALHFRRAGRLAGVQPEMDTNAAEATGDESLAPIEILKLVERSNAVRAALAELGADARSVLLGKYVDGRSVNELAERLGRSPKAIESALSRARTRMRALLGWYFENENLAEEKSP
jgi:RNA polymerase sigma factor (sigma-70 family)